MRRIRHSRLTPFRAGVIGLVLILVATYFAFTRANPFANPFEVQAVFETANNLKARSPVRIAGIEVGTVTAVEPVGDRGAARITMQIKDEGRPLHRDAELRIRPRIFLEGNFFVDVQPGSPSAPELEDGDVIPANQTGTPVQFNELLAVLQSDVRSDLQTFLQEYSTGLREGGADGFRESIQYWERAYRNSTIANDATLGTEEHDLSRLIRGQGRTFRALARNERALRDLVTKFNITAAAFAREDDALQAAIPALRDLLEGGMPALASLNDALPSVSAFARDALPATRSSLPTINASLPFVRQARRLVSERELRGLTRELRPTVPALVRLNIESIPLLEEQRRLSSCQNQVLLPWSQTPIPHPNFPEIDGEPFYKVGPRGLVGLAGESRLHDANSPIQRAAFVAGPQELATTTDEGERLFGTSILPIFGTRPARPDARPAHRPDVPCETQEPPDMNAVLGQGEENVQADSTPRTAADRRRMSRADEAFQQMVQHMRDKARGLPTIDPLRFSDEGLELQAERLQLRPLDDGRFVRLRGASEGAER